MAGVFGLLFAHLWLRLRAPREHSRPIEKLADDELKKQTSKWLSHKFSERRLHVRTAELFGSIVHDHYETSDVDVIVCFNLT
jgi:predicted nucleotidyltransferase